MCDCPVLSVTADAHFLDQRWARRFHRHTGQARARWILDDAGERRLGERQFGSKARQHNRANREVVWRMDSTSDALGRARVDEGSTAITGPGMTPPFERRQAQRPTAYRPASARRKLEGEGRWGRLSAIAPKGEGDSPFSYCTRRSPVSDSSRPPRPSPPRFSNRSRAVVVDVQRRCSVCAARTCPSAATRTAPRRATPGWRSPYPSREYGCSPPARTRGRSCQVAV